MAQPPQHQSQPGHESAMHPPPQAQRPVPSCGRLTGRAALVTGGDSGIGRAVALAFAAEGADVAIGYLNEHEDAEQTASEVRAHGRRCLKVAGDVGDEAFCRQLVSDTVRELGRLDIVVNNAGEQHVQNELGDISAAQLERTFRTNIFSMFHLTKAALPHLREGSAVINTASVTAYQGQPVLIDYSATKGAGRCSTPQRRDHRERLRSVPMTGFRRRDRHRH